MPISIPTTITVSDEGLAAISNALGLGGTTRPSGLDAPAPAPASGERYLEVEFPDRWPAIEDREGEAYQWPNLPLEKYDPFTVYEGTTPEGSIRLGIGHCGRAKVWGKDRLYLITFHITAGGKRPLCEFVETDDYDDTRELVAIIRGNGPGQRSMYPASSALPGAYRKLRTELYSSRIDFRGSWKQQAVVAREDDVDSMLNHSLIQAELRFGISPS